MATRETTRDPYTRRSTRYRGISYRERADGGRTYYVYADGRHLRIEGGEQEALLVQADLRGKLARGLRASPDATTFSELAEEWFATGSLRWRPSTRTSYRIALDTHLLPRFGTRTLAAITPDDVARFVAERQAEGASGSYIAANLRPLNGTMKLALRRGLINANPVAALLPEERPKPSKRRRRSWTPEMIGQLLAAARELGARPGNITDYTPIITLAIYTGMRLGELLGLRWQDVDLKAGLIHIRHQLCRDTRTLVPPKSDAGLRTIPIPPSLVSLLRTQRLASRYSRDEHFLFCSKSGSPLEHRNVAQRGFEAAAEHAGLNRAGERRLTTHDLRHAFASVLAHHGFAAVDLAVVMGHNDARVTEHTYIHPYNETATATRLRAVLGAAMSE
jgi:integrase